jgi:hypothetical protein
MSIFNDFFWWKKKLTSKLKQKYSYCIFNFFQNLNNISSAADFGFFFRANSQIVTLFHKIFFLPGSKLKNHNKKKLDYLI